MLLAPLFLACTATIAATASPASATIILTNTPPSGNDRPPSYVAKATGDLRVQVHYYTWQEWYLWVDAPGYSAQVVPVPTEPKIGPIIGALFVAFPAVWAIGPDSGSTIEVVLKAGKD